MNASGPRPSGSILRQATWRQLSVFETVARLGSFSKAAEELFMTQPGVSIQIRKLAEAVGLPLFEHIGRHVHLTEAGRETLEFARDVLAGASRFEDRVAQMRGLERGRLRLCAVTTAECFLPRLLGPFCARWPGIEVSLEFFNRDAVAQRLKENLDDLAVMGRPPADLEVTVFARLENPIVPVARADHPLARQQQQARRQGPGACRERERAQPKGSGKPPGEAATRASPVAPGAPGHGHAPQAQDRLAAPGRAIALAELMEQPFLARERGSGTRAALEELLTAHGLALHPKLVLGSNEALRQAVLGGLGLCVLPRQAVAGVAGLAELDVVGFPIVRHWHFLHLARKRLPAAAAAFVETVAVPNT